MSHNQQIIVTGASRGIGMETAAALAGEGHHVIAIARTKSKLDDLKNKFPDHITPITADLTNPKSFSNLKRFLEKEAITLSAVIHNAGALVNKPFMETEPEDWNFMIQANLMSAVNLIRACKTHLDSGSHILNIGSMGGFQGSSKFPGLCAYSVSKGALSVLTECLAAEFVKDGINVNCLCLGAVQTEMLEVAFPGIQAPVQPEQMGSFIARFALDAQNYFNGKVLPVSLADPA